MRVAELIGSSAAPNVDGIAHAIGAVSQLPHLVLAGGISNDPLVQAASAAGIERLGVLPDVRAFYRKINVALSPVRFGGGLKIKVFEALASGKPVIATSHSVEGFPEGIRKIVAVEDDFSRWNADLVEKTAAIRPSDIETYYQENFSMDKARRLLSSLI